MQISDNNNYLEFKLKDGNRYQEKGSYGDSATEYIRLQFKTFKKLFDLSAFNQKAGDENDLKNNSKMLSAKQLDKNIDSVSVMQDSLLKNLRQYFHASLKYVNDTAKAWKKTGNVTYLKNEKLFPDSAQDVLYERSISKIAEIKN